MTTPSRPLPTVIGPTENALRALLLAVLATTPISGYEEWVVLNLVDRSLPSAADLVGATSSALGVDVGRAGDLLAELALRGLAEPDDGRWRLTSEGAALLGAARARVGAATGRLVEGLAAADVEATLRVLDVVRERAVAARDLVG